MMSPELYIYSNDILSNENIKMELLIKYKVEGTIMSSRFNATRNQSLFLV